MLVPEFDQITEYWDNTGPHPVAPEQHNLGSLLTLRALQQGYEHVTQLGRSVTLSGEELTAAQSAAAETYHQDVVANEIVSTDPAVIVDALIAVCERPGWHVGLDAVAPTVYFHAGNLYRCVQSHLTQADWAPDAPGMGALWTPYYAPGEIPAWVQPTGAQDAWREGDHVTHAGHTWSSLIAANVWEPGAVGSELLWECEDCEPATDEWTYPHAYTGDNTAGMGNGDVVLYVPNGHLYRCLQTHNSISTWYPGAPGVYLWTDLGLA